MLLTNTDAIHRAFFRYGPRTHLRIDDAASSVVQWQYTFMDLGMCHTIYGECAPDDDPAHAFGGRYRTFVREMHAELMEGGCTCEDCVGQPYISSSANALTATR